MDEYITKKVGKRESKGIVIGYLYLPSEYADTEVMILSSKYKFVIDNYLAQMKNEIKSLNAILNGHERLKVYSILQTRFQALLQLNEEATKTIVALACDSGEYATQLNLLELLKEKHLKKEIIKKIEKNLKSE